METPVIRYNLKDRGRKFTGKERHFNIKVICDAINGPACQETVNSRGMIGYYGHLPRIRFGMTPNEGGVDGGKYVPVEPAFVTTYLKADYDGNVEHKAEFLDTAAGKIAAKLWNSKVGGFSSAIDERRPEFYGLDYVVQPNFLTNSFRGVSLDDVYGGDPVGITYDDVYAAEVEEQSQTVIMLLDSANYERERMNEVIEHLRAENEQMLSMLSTRGVQAASLDSAGITPIAVSSARLERMRRDAAYFQSGELPRIIEPSGKPVDTQVARIRAGILGG